MYTTYPERHRELSRGLRELGDAAPGPMAGFGKLHRAAVTEGVLSSKVKELMAVAIAVSSRCDGCIAFHVRDAVKAGATRDELAVTVGVAVLMGGGPAAIYGVEAMTALDQFEADLASDAT